VWHKHCVAVIQVTIAAVELLKCAYRVFIYHLISYSTDCGTYWDFLDRRLLLIRKLLNEEKLLWVLSECLPPCDAILILHLWSSFSSHLHCLFLFLNSWHPCVILRLEHISFTLIWEYKVSFQFSLLLRAKLRRNKYQMHSVWFDPTGLKHTIYQTRGDHDNYYTPTICI
jgi:hypothetical protein